MNPTQTPENMARIGRLAAERNRARGELRRQLNDLPKRQGCERLAQILGAAPENLGPVRIGKLLIMPKFVGHQAVDRLLKQTRIHPDWMLRDLTFRQRNLLAIAVKNGYRAVPVDQYGRPT